MLAHVTQKKSVRINAFGNLPTFITRAVWKLYFKWTINNFSILAGSPKSTKLVTCNNNSYTVIIIIREKM